MQKYQKVENHQQWAFLGQKKGTIEVIVSWNLQKAQKMYIINSFYKKKAGRKWTWRSPNGIINEIDFFLSNNKSIFQDVSALKRFNTGSDHRIVRARIVFNFRLERANYLRHKKRTPKKLLKPKQINSKWN